MIIFIVGSVLHSDLPNGDEVQPSVSIRMLRNSLERRQELSSLSGSLLNLNEEVDYSKGVPELSGP